MWLRLVLSIEKFSNKSIVELKIYVCEEMINCKFIFHFVKHLRNLKLLSLEATTFDENLHQVLEFPVCIETVDLNRGWAEIDFENIKHIVEKIRKARQLTDYKHILNLLVYNFEEYDTNDMKYIKFSKL